MTELVFPDLRRNPHGVVRGVLASWLAPDGSMVHTGQPLAEIRMAELADRVPALATGTLWHQAEEGEVMLPGCVIGLIE